MTATTRMGIQAILPGVTPSEVVALFSGNTGPLTGRPALSALINLLEKQGASQGRARLTIQCDTATAKAATGTVTIVYASLTAGDKFMVVDGLGTHVLTCVSTTPVNGDGTFQKVTDATASAASLVTAINTLPALMGRWLASNVAGEVTLTAINDTLGLVGNSTKFVKTGNTLALVQPSGGLNPDTNVSVTFTITDVTTAGDTLTLGSRVLTAAASAANQNEWTIGGTAGATATNIAAVINANADLKGLVSATASGTSTGIVTMTLLQGGRIGKLISLAESCSVGTLSATSFAASVADVYAGAPAVINLGVP